MVPNRKISINSKNNLAGGINNRFLVPLNELQERPLTILESVILYLKDKRGLNYHEISELLKRDEANTRHTYKFAKLKKISGYTKKIFFSEILVPASIFANREISAFESLVVYLHEEIKLSLHEIAVLLNRSSSTIRVVNSRARKKYVN
ncbi:hypothetical protein J4449_04360 [Candidatus Woesearchaeota archaeon]|nr:hypothetical protein [Candidatus Woesearchaeota archaeon]